MTRWYRAYEGTVTDAKLGEVALVAGCSRSVAIAAWHCILENCASTNEKGRFDMTPRRCAVILQEPIPTIEAVFAEFAALGLIEGDTVSAWTKRQFESDNSTERSKKHRATSRNGDATLQQRSATPPETETYTETETEKSEEEARAPDPKHWEEVKDALQRPDSLTDWEIEFLHSVKWSQSLSKAQRESLERIKGKLGPPEKSYALPIVMRGTPAYDAWIAHYRRKFNGKAGFYESRESLTVPTEYPPQEQAA